MNYEIASKLKNSGFPQDSDFWWKLNDKGVPELIYRQFKDKEGDVYLGITTEFCPKPGLRTFITENDVAIPTLSQLIEACGYDLSHIKRYNSQWWAVSHTKYENNNEDSINNLEEVGSTPEEAVANLYLLLYNKDNEKQKNKNEESNLPNNSLVS